MRTLILNLSMLALLVVPGSVNASCECGDINGDGRVTVSDAAIIMRMAMGREPKGLRTATPADTFVAYVDPETGELLDSPPAGTEPAPGDVMDPESMEGMVAYVDPETGEFVDERPEGAEAVPGDVMEPQRLSGNGMVAYIDPDTGELVSERPEGVEPPTGDLRTPSCLVLQPRY
jgi:hypothetical protein